MSGSAEQHLDQMLRRYGVAGDAAAPLEVLLQLLARPDAPTAVHDPTRAIDVHIADSLAGLELDELRSARRIADLGAGAGLPGLVLAAVLPESEVSLLDSSRKKCEFIRRAIMAMELRNAAAVWSRAEDWREGLGKCDAVCARALAALPVLCEYAAPLLREGGVLVAWKGAVPHDEAENAAAAARHLGLGPGVARPVVPFAGSEARTLHVFRKVEETPATFPRRPGMATKRPLSARNLR